MPGAPTMSGAWAAAQILADGATVGIRQLPRGGVGRAFVESLVNGFRRDLPERCCVGRALAAGFRMTRGTLFVEQAGRLGGLSVCGKQRQQ